MLSHRAATAQGAPAPGTEERLSVLRAHIARADSHASAEPHRDAVGAALPLHARVRWPVADGTRAAIVIPTRDRLDLLGPCLASITASLAANRVELELLVVDNRSEQGMTAAVLRQFEHLGQIRLLHHDGRFNWAEINNRAAEQTDADVLIFLNNDTIMITPDAWDELCATALRPDVGAVGARLLYEDGTIQHAGVVIDDWLMFATHEGVGAPASDPGYLGRHALMRQTSAVTGACLATRASVFRENGGFDAVNFPVEGNDTDYCLRLRARGLKVLYDPYATFYHFESKSRGYNVDQAKRQRAEDATRILRERWADRFGHDPFYNPHFDRLSPPFTRLRPPSSLEA